VYRSQLDCEINPALADPHAMNQNLRAKSISIKKIGILSPKWEKLCTVQNISSYPQESNASLMLHKVVAQTIKFDGLTLWGTRHGRLIDWGSGKRNENPNIYIPSKDNILLCLPVCL
jgi:hypothetical protein